MERKKKSILIFAIVSVILLAIVGYLGVVCYFFLFDSNNISGKLGVWGFCSTEDIGNMYLDASFSIGVGEEQHSYGINVREDGYVVTALTELGYYQEKKILLYANNGSIYNGNVVFADEYYNLAVIKVSSLNEENEKIALPYVKVSSFNNRGFGSLISVNLSGTTKSYDSVELLSDGLETVAYYEKIDGQQIVSRVFENAFYYNSKQNVNGAILNKKGELLGIYVNLNSVLDEYSPAAISVDFLNSVIGNIVKSTDGYKSELVENLNGLDMIQLESDIASRVVGEVYYYNGKQVPDEFIDIYSSLSGVYLLDDFSYGGQTIEKANLITSVSCNGDRKTITTVYELVNFFYGLSSGSTFKIFSYNMSDFDIENPDTNVNETTFVVE